MNAASAPLGIAGEFHALEAIAMRPVASAAELEVKLRQLYNAFVGVDLDRHDLAEVRTLAPSLMQSLFEMRLGLRHQIATWSQRGLMTPAVQKGLRDVFRVARYANDMLGELLIGFETRKNGSRAFTGLSRRTHVNPAFFVGSDIFFRSGDVILVRGTAHNSAAIARIGDVDSQFSHAGIVYVDLEQKPWVVEALIEVGSKVSTLASFLDHGNGRAVLYRHRDKALAERSAQFIYDRVRMTEGRWRKPILYDFSMSLDGYKELFCTKVVRYAYLSGSKGKLALPTFKTRLDMSNRDFLDRIGVKAKETFAPGDLDLEPEFDLVAEWQDYRLTSKLRLKDLLMDKIFEWMEQDGWVFRETTAIRLVSTFGKAGSYLSEDAKGLLESVMPRVPVNMRRRTVAAIIMLHKTGEELLSSLAALEDDTIRMRGRPANPREIFGHLDKIRDRSDGEIGYLVAPR